MLDRGHDDDDVRVFLCLRHQDFNPPTSPIILDFERGST